MFINVHWSFGEGPNLCLSLESGAPVQLPQSTHCEIFPTSLCSRAAAEVHDHWGNFAVDDLLPVVEVEHVDGRHLGGRAAGPCGAPRVGLVHQVCVRVLLQVHLLALSGAVVGLVALRRDDPVPSKVLKVHGEGIAAAAGLRGALVAVQAGVSSGAFRALRYLHLQEGLLQARGTANIWLVITAWGPNWYDFETMGDWS